MGVCLMDDKILEAFSFGRVQECKSIMLKLNEHGISQEEFVEWVDNHTNREIKVPKEPRQEPRRKCPNCGKPLVIRPVNNSTATIIEHYPELKSVWVCDACKFDEYSEKSIADESKPYLVKAETTPMSKGAKRRKKTSGIIHPREHNMLYYGNPRRRMK